eukprot:TRINITY_DN8736_c0_g1_i1.p1 TRINITY_DN8736_c0_g1~~TRINITY_DN8736_c0_g1_i1.p1  ORF type:complete len:133 (+),score=11.91 TRINITY_DN8736_c0_g1_i1:63-461(+)
MWLKPTVLALLSSALYWWWEQRTQKNESEDLIQNAATLYLTGMGCGSVMGKYTKQRNSRIWANGERRMYWGQDSRWHITDRVGDVTKNLGLITSDGPLLTGRSKPHLGQLPHQVDEWDIVAGRQCFARQVMK